VREREDENRTREAGSADEIRVGASLVWNDSLLVIESEAVRGEAAGCIAWLGCQVSEPDCPLGSLSIIFVSEIQLCVTPPKGGERTVTYQEYDNII
jgi:hypothetical protein